MAALRKDLWEALYPLLEHALDLPPSERATWLAEQRAKNPTVVGELERLLAAEERLDAEGFLQGSGYAPLFAGEPSLAGQRLGAYTLERPIGHGGMGSVWLGRRSDGRYEGQVAIKFLNIALLGQAGEERFKREGDVLA